ncbi:hypothetical protein HCH54_005259 [Aspergillus fumigatus]
MPIIQDHMDRNNSDAVWDAAASNSSSNQRRGNVFEDIHADERVFQFIGSANAHTTLAKSVSAKLLTTQCLGDLSDTSLQQISSDRRSTALDAAGQSGAANTAKAHGQGRRFETNGYGLRG